MKRLNRKGSDIAIGIIVILGVILFAAVIITMTFKSSWFEGTKTIKTISSCTGTMGGVIAGNGQKGVCRDARCNSDELYGGEVGCSAGKVCCFPNPNAADNGGTTGTAGTTGTTGSKPAAQPNVYACPAGSSDGCAGKTGHYVYNYNPGGGSANLGCVYEYENGKPGLCWQCTNPSPYCGYLSTEYLEECSSESSGEDDGVSCQGQPGIPVSDYKYNWDATNAMCVYNPSTKGKDGKPVCWRCNTAFANCGQRLHWYNCENKRGEQDNDPNCKIGLFVGDYTPTPSKAQVCVFEWLDPSGVRSSLNINYCWVCDKNKERCGSGYKG
jgi:hypothetical protein